jgi:hypothetical protein
MWYKHCCSDKDFSLFFNRRYSFYKCSPFSLLLTFTQVRSRIQSSLVKLTISKRKRTNASIIPLCSISKRNESIYKAKETGLFLNLALWKQRTGLLLHLTVSNRNPFDPSRYYSAVWKQSILLAVWDKTSVGSQ